MMVSIITLIDHKLHHAYQTHISGSKDRVLVAVAVL